MSKTNEAKATAITMQLAAIREIANRMYEANKAGSNVTPGDYAVLRAELEDAQAVRAALLVADPVPAFRTGRSALLAMGKAEKAYEAAYAAECAKVGEISKRADYDTWRVEMDAAYAAKDAAYNQGAAVYAQAVSQKFYVRSYHFGHNTHRDLVAANND